MYSSAKKCSPKKILLPFIALFFISCSSFNSPKTTSPLSAAWLPKDGPPPTVAVLPFDNLTSDIGMGPLVRRSFYNHFSSKNYRDIELGTVDQILESISEKSGGPWRDVPPETLGGYVRADYLVYGKVKEYQRIFLGVYSQIVLSVEIKLVESATGKGVWAKAETKRSHEGGVPIEWLSLVSATVRSGLHLQEEKTLDLVERINRELTDEIPEPALPPAAVCSLQIQVASFLEKNRALATVEDFKRMGFEARVEPVQFTEYTWYRVVLGPYRELLSAERDRMLIVEKTRFEPLLIQPSPVIQ